MTGNMKTAVMKGIRQCVIEERPIPVPGDEEVLVKIENVGVCGSDLHYFEKGRIGDFIVEYPFVLGHEAGGTVVEVGKNVKNLKIGDKVALEPGKTCGKCEFCKSGKYNLCPDVEFFATPPYDGVFSEYVAHTADLCFKIPDNMTTEEAALIEPLAVGMHAAAQGNARIGQIGVVTGCGCIGLMSILSMKARGVSKVIAVDIVERRLEMAARIGADYVINGKEEDVAAKIGELTGDGGFDIAIDTAGSDITIRQLVESSKPGATIVFVGYSANGMISLPLDIALNKEITFKTVFRYRNIYPAAIAAVAEKKIDVSAVVTHRFELDDIQEALTACADDKVNIVKGVIKVAD